MERAQSVIDEARQRLQLLLDEYLTVEAELRRLEDTEFRVCIFGSARISEKHPTYQEVYRLAKALAKLGIDIVTGGGPGLMEAANRGVRDARNEQSKSYGLPIDLPLIQEPANLHLDIKSHHKRFSSRLDEFIRLTHAVIVAPGGIGTLLELMYVWQLLQVGLVERRPVILLGREFWEGMMVWMREQMLEKGYISARDFEWIQIVDSPREAVALVRAELDRFRAAHPQTTNGHLTPPTDPTQAADQVAVARDALQRTADVTQAAMEDLDRTAARLPTSRRRPRIKAAVSPNGSHSPPENGS